MKAEIVGDNLVVTIPLDKEGSLSKSTGATYIHASSGGGKATDLQVKGKPLTVSLLAWTKNEAYVKPKK